MGHSPKRRRKQGLLMSLWIILSRLISFSIACLMAFTSYLQMERSDALVWVPMFLVPSLLTFTMSVNLRAVERLEVLAVTSVHIGCCLCYLVYLVTRLIRVLTKESSGFALVDQGDLGNNGGAPGLLSYPEAWECIAVMMVVGWLKFTTITFREHLREMDSARSEVSPIKMLWTLGAVMILPFCLLAFCYIDGLLPFMSRAASTAVLTAHNALRFAVDANPPA